jgi:hypothetical protein
MTLVVRRLCVRRASLPNGDPELAEEWIKFEAPHSDFFQDTIIRVDASNGLQIEEKGN